jgi:hypothetical protein
MVKKTLALMSIITLGSLLISGCNRGTSLVSAENDLSQNESAAADPTPTCAQEVASGPAKDSRWCSSTLLTLDREILGVKIVAYRIQWFSGGWSAWYVPGVNDLYQKSGEPVRRVWACFNDHNFKYLAVPSAAASSLRCYAEFDKGIVTPNIQNSGVVSSSFGPSNNTEWVNNLSIGIDRQIDKQMIVAYKITWFNGSKSGWIVPGYFDVYQKSGESARRWWACFNDHSHEYLAFPLY